LHSKQPAGTARQANFLFSGLEGRKTGLSSARGKPRSEAYVRGEWLTA
jgi:hypothetical protein